MKNKVIINCFVVLVLLSLCFASTNPYGFVIAESDDDAVEWMKTFGGAADDSAWAVIETDDGGFALAGGTDSFGAGDKDIWLVKTDPNGNHVWNMTYGGSGLDWGWSRSLVQTSDGGFALAGGTDSFGAGGDDFWLVKTDANGNPQWNKTYGGPDNDVLRAFIHTSDGGFALFGGTESYGLGVQDWWLVKTDNNGNPQWNKTYGGYGNDRGLSMVQTIDVGFALEGGTQSYGSGGADYWLIKTDANGQAVWNETYGGPLGDYGNTIIETDDMGFAIAGGAASYAAGEDDIWLVKTDSNGQLEWNASYGGVRNENCHSVIELLDDGFALVGWTSSYGAGDDDLWLVRTGTNGQPKWNKTFGGSGDDKGKAIILTTDGSFVLAGGTSSNGAGGQDFWLIKIRDTAPVSTTPTSTPSFESFVILSSLCILVLITVKKRKR